MEKKMTKAQEKEMERVQQEKKYKRYELVRSVKNFWDDIKAVERVAKLNNDNSKIDYHGDLIKSEGEKLLSNYENLKFLSNIDSKKDKSWSVVRAIVSSEDIRNNYYGSYKDTRLKEYLKEGCIWIDDIIWSHNEMKLYIKLLQEYGIDYIYYTNSSTGALGNITSLIQLGATIVGTTNIYKDGEGLIFDIRNARYQDLEENMGENENDK